MKQRPNFGWAMLGLLVASFFGFGESQGRAQGLSCTTNTMAGLWRAEVITDAPWDTTVKLVFQFGQDGRYAYAAGQGNFLWTTHQGSYAIVRNSGESSRSYPCLIQLTPDPSTVKVNPENRLGLAPLQARNLMDNQQRTFRIQPLGARLVLHSTDLNWRDVGMFSIERAQN